MAKSESVFRVISSFVCPSGDLFSLAPENCSADKYSGHWHLLLFLISFQKPKVNSVTKLRDDFGFCLGGNVDSESKVPSPVLAPTAEFEQNLGS